jgi:hypothetical protein
MTQSAPTPRAAAAQVANSYSGGQQPLRAYAGVMGVYTAAVVGLGVLARRTGRRIPDRLSLGDVMLLSVATFRLSRLLTKDAVTSPVRAPFARYKEPGGPSEVNEEPRGSGARHAVGELLTCPFCVSQWVATGFVFGHVFAPRATRLAASTLAAVAASDALQLAFSAAQPG